jgi:hypothetical protein
MGLLLIASILLELWLNKSRDIKSIARISPSTMQMGCVAKNRWEIQGIGSNGACSAYEATSNRLAIHIT